MNLFTIIPIEDCFKNDWPNIDEEPTESLLSVTSTRVAGLLYNDQYPPTLETFAPASDTDSAVLKV